MKQGIMAYLPERPEDHEDLERITAAIALRDSFRGRSDTQADHHQHQQQHVEPSAMWNFLQETGLIGST